MSVLVGLAGKIIIIMPQVIIITILTAVIQLLISIFFKPRTIEKLSGKKVFLFGPPKSGKTTFFNWLENKPTYSYNQSGEIVYKEYFDKEHNIKYSFGDMGGADGFLLNRLVTLYKEHDLILMFFNYSQYICDDEYRAKVQARFEVLDTLNKTEGEKPVLLIGSHYDKLTDDQKKGVGSPLADESKSYFIFLGRLKLVLCNLTEKMEALSVLKEISQMMEETK